MSRIFRTESSAQTSSWRMPALLLALASANVVATEADVDPLLKAGAPLWKVSADQRTSSSNTVKVVPVSTVYVPRTALGKRLAVLRARIVEAGGTRPAAELTAELLERRGTA